MDCTYNNVRLHQAADGSFVFLRDAAKERGVPFAFAGVTLRPHGLIYYAWRADVEDPTYYYCTRSTADLVRLRHTAFEFVVNEAAVVAALQDN